MNLELMFRDLQEMREAQKASAEAQRLSAEANMAGIAELRFEGQAQRERIDVLVGVAQNLLVVAEAHHNRIEKLERKSA